jgi:hypothetical protein
MCVLCGEFVMKIHWTDQTSSDESEIRVGDKQRDRQSVLAFSGLVCVTKFYVTTV